MKKTVVVIACAWLVVFAGCERIEKGMEGKKQAKELQEQVNKSIKEIQKTGQEATEGGEKKAGDEEKGK